MDPEEAQLFFAVLTLFTIVGIIVVTVSRLVGSRVGSAVSLTAAISRISNPLAAAVALTTMAGSLYFSEVANYVPCTLCWYQRIAMYPLGLILVIATIRRESVRAYVVPLAAIGAVISLYHWLLERFPDIDAGVCSAQIPCDLVWFEKFGFITLPFMALTGFIAVIVLTTLPIED